MGRIPSLDGLRAVSMLLVVVGHWCFRRYSCDTASPYAVLGVRVFFVISGYLITTLLIREHAETGSLSLRRFYLRRAFRIFPAAAVFMAVTFTVFWPQLKWYDIAVAALYLSNYNLLPPWMLGHLWSLSVEEQFYFLWPLVLRNWFRRRARILSAVIVCAPVFTVATYLLKLPAVLRTLPTTAGILAIGCLLAIVCDRIPTPKSTHLTFALIVIALAPLVTFNTRLRTLAWLFLVWPLLHISIACVVLYVIRRPPRLLNIAPVVWLGKISYSVYLWQQLFSFAPKPHPWIWLAFPILAGAASYYLVERPALQLRDRRDTVVLHTLPAYSHAAGD